MWKPDDDIDGAFKKAKDQVLRQEAILLTSVDG